MPAWKKDVILHMNGDKQSFGEWFYLKYERNKTSGINVLLTICRKIFHIHHVLNIYNLVSAYVTANNLFPFCTCSQLCSNN